MTCIKDGNRTIIVISGKQLSGKDFFAQLLLNKLPDFKRVGLGDAIKMEFGRLNNLTFEEIEQNKHVYRPELINLGNKGRELDEGLFWIKKVLAVDGNLIVPDMRVKKEFNAFRKAGAIMVRVEAERDVRLSRGTMAKENDPTECALDGINEWDIVINNNSDPENLETEAEKLLKLIPEKVITNK